MTDNALLANLIMDKFKKSTGPRRRRSSRRKPGKKAKKRTRRWKLVKLPSGLKIQVAKAGWLQTPQGRYVRDTVANRAKHYPELSYAPGATDVPLPPAAMEEE